MATSLFPDANPVQVPFGFPEPLTEKYRPHLIAGFVGLEKPKKILSKLAANPFPSACLLGAIRNGQDDYGLSSG